MKRKKHKGVAGTLIVAILIFLIWIGLSLWRMELCRTYYLKWEQAKIQKAELFFLVVTAFCGLFFALQVCMGALSSLRKSKKLLEMRQEIEEKELEINRKNEAILNLKQKIQEEEQEVSFEICKDGKLGVYNGEFARSLLNSLDARSVTDVHLALLKARIVKKVEGFGWKNIAEVIQSKLDEGEVMIRIGPRNIAVVCLGRSQRAFEIQMEQILKETEAKFKKAELRMSMKICSKLSEDESIVEILEETIEEKLEANAKGRKKEEA